jgi:hypothetical protein
MKRITFVSAVVLVLGVHANANAPSQAEIDACNKEVAAVAPSPSALSEGHTAAVARDGASAGQPTREVAPGADPQSPTPKGETPGGAPSAANASQGTTVTAASRAAFAACLARHGYYKGYNRAPGG